MMAEEEKDLGVLDNDKLGKRVSVVASVGKDAPCNV